MQLRTLGWLPSNFHWDSDAGFVYRDVISQTDMTLTLFHRVMLGAVLPVAAVLFSFAVYLLWWQ